MKSEEVLLPVIQNLELVSRWRLDSEGAALALMRSKLTETIFKSHFYFFNIQSVTSYKPCDTVS